MDELAMDKLMRQLVRHEGLRLKPYRCTAGKLTIGIGHNIDDNGLPDWLQGRNLYDAGITTLEAYRLLHADVAIVISKLTTKIPTVFLGLSPARKAVLVNMAFNMGVGNAQHGLLSFRNTLKHIEKSEFDAAADCMLVSKWAKQVGKRALELSRQMRFGEWIE